MYSRENKSNKMDLCSLTFYPFTPTLKLGRMTVQELMNRHDKLYHVKDEKGIHRTAYLSLTSANGISLDVDDWSEGTRKMFGGDYEFNIVIEPKSL